MHRQTRIFKKSFLTSSHNVDSRSLWSFGRCAFLWIIFWNNSFVKNWELSSHLIYFLLFAETVELVLIDLNKFRNMIYLFYNFQKMMNRIHAFSKLFDQNFFWISDPKTPHTHQIKKNTKSGNISDSEKSHTL